jgi:hypothetical protein
LKFRIVELENIIENKNSLIKEYEGKLKESNIKINELENKILD